MNIAILLYLPLILVKCGNGAMIKCYNRIDSKVIIRFFVNFLFYKNQISAEMTISTPK